MRKLCERGLLNYVVQEKKAFCISPEFIPMPEEDAELEICRRYLSHTAPAIIQDMCYYFKCTRKQAKLWLSRFPVKSLNLGGDAYFYLGELEGDYPEIPPCLFPAGIVFSAVLLDGVVCGKWKRTKGKLEVISFHVLTEAEKRAITTAAEKLWGKEITSLVLQ